MEAFMPAPKSVEIMGKPIKEVLGVNISCNTTVGSRGGHESRTNAITVQLFRRARQTPNIELYRAATNGDGRFNVISGKIILQNAKKEETYTINMKEAYVSDWTFSQQQNDGYLSEVITLQVGNM